MNTKVNRKLRSWAVSALTIQFLYHSLQLIESLFVRGEFYAALISLAGGLVLILIAVLIHVLSPGFKYLPVAMGVLTQIMLLAFGIWHQELYYYYIIMLLVVCSVTSMRDFKLQATLQGITFIIDLFTLIFIFPRFEWINILIYFK
jgi:hypothetical protein